MPLHRGKQEFHCHELAERTLLLSIGPQAAAKGLTFQAACEAGVTYTKETGLQC